jgi:hypothetical protein
MLRRCTWLVLLAIPLGAFPDSIKVGEEVFDGVIVERDEEYYFVHFTEEGRVEKISRKRQDVGEPTIEPDNALRERMLKRFNDKLAAAKKDEADAVNEPVSEINNAAIEESTQLGEQALFDAQLAYWMDLSAADRMLIEDNLVAHADGEHRSYALTRQAVVEEVVDLEARKAMHEARLVQLGQLKQRALDDAQRDGAAGRFMALYNGSIYDYEAIPHGQAIASINATIVEVERTGIVEENKSVDGGIRAGTFLGRIDQLDGAIADKYVSPLKATEAASWKDSGNQETAPFEITTELWRIDCLRDDLGQAGSFTVTVYDAESRQPFTRISHVDFLQMRVRVLDGPGRYYLVIEQDGSNIPYDIRAVELAK